MRLSKLGWTEPFSELDCLTAEAMLIIDAEVESMKADQMKKTASKTGK